MTRREFLRGLEEALQMDVPQSVIRNQLAYYDQYISDEIAKGRSEKEVLDELGDPRLIARTIEDATEAAGESYTDADYRDSGSSYTNTYSDVPGEERRGPFSGNRGMHFETSSTMGCLLLSIILIVVLGIIGTIVGALLPILTPVIAVLLIYWLIKGIMDR